MKMKSLSFIIFALVLFFATPAYIACSDEIILKDGSKIECATVWEANGIVHCYLYGQTVGYPKERVEQIISDESDQQECKECFSFDVWRSGMTIEKVMDVAAKNDIPILKEGVIYEMEHFNPELSRMDMYTATEFYYNATLMSKPAIVTLYFTPRSRLLKKIKIHLHSVDINRKTPYPKEIEALLGEKYGKPARPMSPEPLYDTATWEVGGNFTVEMRTGAMYVNIIYTEIQLEKLSAEEQNAIEDQKRKADQVEDANKF